MKIEVQNWKISELLQHRHSIDLNPAYQRGPAWTSDKQCLLLDSIFGKYDLPKVYLAAKGSLAQNKFEVVDGQQRLRAIYAFLDGTLAINKSSVRGPKHEGKIKFNHLSQLELDCLHEYELTVSITEGASPLYKRTLFARLQLGERLNPAELRNALQSSAPKEFNSITLTHTFFKVAGIPDKRYKRDDYLTHTFAFLAYDRTAQDFKDIKAQKLKEFVLEKRRGLDLCDLKTTETILNFMEKIVRIEQKVFRNKWSFFDAFLYFYRNLELIDKCKDLKSLALQFSTIEKTRQTHGARPDKILEKGAKVSEAELLYHYIVSYKAGGAVRENIKKRSAYLDAVILL